LEEVFFKLQIKPLPYTGFTIKAQGIMKKAFSIKGKVIDHKNGNRSKNSLSNLRGVSYSKNNSNKHGHLYPHARDIYGK
jgi:hypothetical protein